MILLDGKKLAEEQKVKLQKRIAALKKRKITPGLAVILVGEHPASSVYVKNKEKLCAELGLDFFLVKFKQSATADQIKQKIRELNKDKKVHGIIIQLPLPLKLNPLELIAEVDPKKDVDGLHPMNIGLLPFRQELFVPATPQGVMALLQKYKITLAGKKVVLVGLGYTAGLPLSLMLVHQKATLTIAQDKTSDLPKLLKDADIVISAVGQPGLIKGSMIKTGAVVIDIGITKQGAGWLGDVEFKSVAKRAKYLTPVPGGVGPLTVSSLINNLILAAEYWGTGAGK